MVMQRPAGDGVDSSVLRMYTTNEVAEIFGVTTETVRDWIKTNRLRAHRLGGNGHWRVNEADLREFGQHTFASPPSTVPGSEQYL